MMHFFFKDTVDDVGVGFFGKTSIGIEMKLETVLMSCQRWPLYKNRNIVYSFPCFASIDAFITGLTLS